MGIEPLLFCRRAARTNSPANVATLRQHRQWVHQISGFLPDWAVIRRPRSRLLSRNVTLRQDPAHLLVGQAGGLADAPEAVPGLRRRPDGLLELALGPVDGHRP